MAHARRLRKSKDEKILFGVAGGVADYFDFDPVLVRVAWVLLSFATSGVALLVYIVMAFVMPGPRQATADGDSNPAGEDTADVEEPTRDTAGQRRRKTTNILAAGLIVIGVVVLLTNLGVFGSIRWDIVWPVVIIALGLALLVPRLRG